MKSIQKPGKIFDWVNSIDLPSCKLASSVEDLKSGIVLCDITAYIKSRPLFEGVKRHEAHIYRPQSSSVHNFNLFFKEMSSNVPLSLQYPPEELYNRPEKVIPILEFLRTLLPNLERRKGHRRMLSSFETTASSTDSEGLNTVVHWLRSLNLAPSDLTNLIEHLKDGTVLCLLVNKLEGNKEAIKGYQMHPKSNVMKHSNVSRAMGYLKKRGKPVCNIIDFLNGNPEIIISFLLELKACYTLKAKRTYKASYPDNVYEIAKPIERRVHPRNRNMSVKNISVEDKFIDRYVLKEFEKMNPRQNDYFGDKEFEKMKPRQNNYFRDKEFEKVNPKQKDDFRDKELEKENPRQMDYFGGKEFEKMKPRQKNYFRDKELEKENPRQKDYFSDKELEKENPRQKDYFRDKELEKENPRQKDYFRDKELEKENSRQNDFFRNKENPRQNDFFTDKENEKEMVREWVNKLGLRYYMKNEFICNGILVAEIIKIVENISVPGICYNPRSVSENRSNFKLALNALRHRNPEIALKYTQELDRLLKGEAVWSLLRELMSSYSMRAVQNLDFREIVLWVNSLGLIHVNSFEELIVYIQEGSFLCDLVQTCLKSGVPKLNRNPRTIEDRINNIEKALFVLKQHPRIPDKFSKVQRILEGDEEFIYELVNTLRKNSVSDRYAMTRMGNFESFSSLDDMNSTRQNFRPKYNKFSWIYNILGVSDLDFDKEYLPEFSNGTLLCELLNKLGREDIHINYSSKSQASALHNIEKALQVLRNKASFPSELFFVEEDILRGSSEIIRQVLTHIRDIYKMSIHTRCKSSKNLRPKF